MMTKDIKQLVCLILFEIVHEDALNLLPDVVWIAIHRADDYVYIFERSILK